MNPMISFTVVESEKKGKIKKLKHKLREARNRAANAESKFDSQARTIGMMQSQHEGDKAAIEELKKNLCELPRYQADIQDKAQRIADLTAERDKAIEAEHIAKHYPISHGTREGESLLEYNWSVYVAWHKLPYGHVGPQLMTAHQTEAEALDALSKSWGEYESSIIATYPRPTVQPEGGYIANLGDAPDAELVDIILFSGKTRNAVQTNTLMWGVCSPTDDPASHESSIAWWRTHSPATEWRQEPATTPKGDAQIIEQPAPQDADAGVAHAVPTLGRDRTPKEQFESGGWVTHGQGDRPLFVARKHKLYVEYCDGSAPSDVMFACDVDWHAVKDYKRA